MNLGHVDYSKVETPKGYKCAPCGATGVKLWFPHMMAFPDCLACAPCAAEKAGVSVRDIDDQGKRTGEHGRRTVAIGNFDPAVPTEKGETFWVPTGAPDDACAWWYNLPTLPQPSTSP